jgi:hypothetical protein
VNEKEKRKSRTNRTNTVIKTISMRAEIDLKVGSKKDIEQQLPNHVIVKVFAHWLNIKLEV